MGGTRGAASWSPTVWPLGGTAQSSGAATASTSSSNGTWIYIDGEKGVLLKGESIVLRKRGWIGFGPARFADSDVVEFCA